MREYLQFYIDGQWVDPVKLEILDVVNPANEEVNGRIANGSAADVDKAVMAARRAFDSWSQTSREERMDVLARIIEEYQKRHGDLADAITAEMGAPASLAQQRHVPAGSGHFMTTAKILRDFEFEEARREIVAETGALLVRKTRVADVFLRARQIDLLMGDVQVAAEDDGLFFLEPTHMVQQGPVPLLPEAQAHEPGLRVGHIDIHHVAVGQLRREGAALRVVPRRTEAGGHGQRLATTGKALAGAA